MQNFETVPKQLFRIFYNETKNFAKCTLTATSFSFLQKNAEF